MQMIELEKRFSYHEPRNDDVRMRFERIREEFFRLASIIDSLTPDSREQSLAFTALEEAMFWANAVIARNQEFLPPLDVFERRFGEKL